MESHFSLESIRSYSTNSNTEIKKTRSVETIVIPEDDFLKNIKERENIKLRNEKTVKKENNKKKIRFENIIRNNEQLVDFCLKRNLTKINILYFLCAFNFKRLFQFEYLENDNKYSCRIHSGKMNCISTYCNSKIEAKNEAIDSFFEKYFFEEKRKIDQVYNKHKRLYFRTLLPHLREQLQFYLLNSTPKKNAYVSIKDKRKSEKEFDEQFYSVFKEKESECRNDIKMKEALDSHTCDKLYFYDPEIINFLDIYNTSPYKIFSSFKEEYENKLSIKEELLQINFDHINNIKYSINFPEIGSLFEGVSKNKKYAQELAAQKFLKKTFSWKEFLDLYENKQLFKQIS